MTKSYHFFDIILGVFVAVLLISNIASSAKIVDLGFSIFGIRMAFDAGTILFPIGYIFGDILTEVYGYERSRRVIWTGFFSLALASGVFWFIARMPGESTWQGYAGDTAYQSILGGMSSGGIVLASLAAYWLGEFSNSFVLAKMKILTSGRWLWSRTIGSTLIGEFIDTFIFVIIASTLHVFPWSLFLPLTLSNYIFKVSMEALLTPVTYVVINFLKRAEHEDVYDKGTNFNPFIV